MRSILKRFWPTLLVVLFLIPATLYLGSLLPGRSYYLTSTLIVLYTLFPFFMAFERRKPQARELVTIAVMCAIAVASRAAFAMMSHFKPTIAIIMLTGIAFGPEAGFLTGAVSAFASNFFFGQGPHTPWQMLSYGVAGLLAGLCFRKKGLPRERLALAFFGFFAVALLIGPLLDTGSVFTAGAVITPAFVLSVYAAGIPVNLLHGAATFLTMLLIGPAMLEKLDRLKRKYGMPEHE